jgi:ribosomal protein S18 acetylase RimI-like enzyme
VGLAVDRGYGRLSLETGSDAHFAAARALYARSGFVEMGRRRGYYSHADGRREDALTLVLNFSR